MHQLLLRQFARSKSTATEPQPAPDSASGQRLARVRAVLLALRPKYQTLVVLRYYAQMSYDDIAEVLGCRQEAVRARLSRASSSGSTSRQIVAGSGMATPNAPTSPRNVKGTVSVSMVSLGSST